MTARGNVPPGGFPAVHLSTDSVQRLDDLAQAVDCGTADDVRWEIAETLDKCAGTKARILDQIHGGQDCDVCPPGFLAVVGQAEKLARALGIALDALGVAPLPADANADPLQQQSARALEDYRTMTPLTTYLPDPDAERYAVQTHTDGRVDLILTDYLEPGRRTPDSMQLLLAPDQQDGAWPKGPTIDLTPARRRKLAAALLHGLPTEQEVPR